MTKYGPWIDVTVPLKVGMPFWPSDPPFERSAHKTIGVDGHCQVSLLRIGTHTGTHIDAPRHFFEDGPTVDQLDLGKMIGPAKVIEIVDPVVVKVTELEGKGIAAGDRILLKTRSSALWRKDGFAPDFVCLTLAAAEFLVSRGVVLVGIDYLSVGGYKHSEGAAVHRTLLGAGICVVEGLDLSEVAPGNYEMVCLPLRLEHGDGAPARVLLRRS